MFKVKIFVMRKPKIAIFLAVYTLIFSFTMGISHGVNFETCVGNLKSQARADGIDKQIIKQAFAVAKPKKEVIEKAEKQPEFVTPIWQYIDNAVSPHRLKYGADKLKENEGLFTALEELYGVDRHILTAIWGMETSYGAFQGRKNTIASLVTLACYDKKRQKYAKKQLSAALKILDRGDISVDKMEGSWAGAMGHTQFIPTTYEAYAVDVDGDLKLDIWNSKADALASAANYLRARKWSPNLPWGFEVKLPSDFNYALNDRDKYRDGRFWHKQGVKQVNGKAISFQDQPLALIAPAGAKGPAFILTTNFKSILAYNRSTAYAISIGHLSDRLQNKPAFHASWPTDNVPLTFSERKSLQQNLSRLGLYDGDIDGMIGSGSIKAIKMFQERHGLLPDGYAGKKLLAKLKSQ